MTPISQAVCWPGRPPVIRPKAEIGRHDPRGSMNPVFADLPVSVFEVMPALAREHDAINLGQDPLTEGMVTSGATEALAGALGRAA